MARSRLAKVSLITAAVLVGVLVAAIGGASVLLQGRRLGALIEGAVAGNRGQMQFGGVHWKLRALWDLATGRPTPVVIEGLRIIDPEGTVVLDVPRLEAEVDLGKTIGGNIIIHKLKMGTAHWRFAAMKGKLKNPKGEPDMSIGFTAALASKNPAPEPAGPPPPRNPDAPPAFQIVSADIGDLTAVFDFPGAWGLELNNIQTTASLVVPGKHPKHPIEFDCKPVHARGGGYLKILDDYVLPFDRVAINRVATAPEWPDAIFLDLEHGDTGRSRLVGKGTFTGIYQAPEAGIDLHAEFHDAADALAGVAANLKHKVPGITVSGEGARVTADLKDAFARLKINASFAGLDIGFNDYRTRGLGFELAFLASPLKVEAKKLTFQAPGGGSLTLDAALFDGDPDPKKDQLLAKADLRLDALTTDSYLPPAAATLASGKLSGRLRLESDLDRNAHNLRTVDITLARSRRGKLPRSIRLHGEAQASPETVKTSGLTVSVPGASVTAQGQVNLAKKMVRMGVDVLANDLHRLLRDAGQKPLAQQARVAIEVDGSLTGPRVEGEAVVSGIDIETLLAAAEASSRFSFDKGTARLDSLTVPIFGGRVQASGTVRIFDGSVDRPLRAPILDVAVQGREIDLQEMYGALAGGAGPVAPPVPASNTAPAPEGPAAPLLTGHLSFDASASGPLDRLAARFKVPSGTRLGVLGEPWRVAALEVELAGPEIQVKSIRMVRDAGGTVDLRGTVTLAQAPGASGGGRGRRGSPAPGSGPIRALSLDLELAGVPLGGLPGIAEQQAELRLSGTASANLHVEGTPERPAISGQVRLAAVKVKGLDLGDATIVLRTTSSGTLEADGDLFGRLRLTASAAFTDGLSASATLAFDSFTVDAATFAALKPGMGIADPRVMTSGRVGVEVRPDQPLAVDARLTELVVSMVREVVDADGEVASRRFEIRNAGELHVAVVGDRIDVDEMRFLTNGGELRVKGRLDGKDLWGEVHGHVDLALAAPFLPPTLEKLTGDVTAHLVASGRADKTESLRLSGSVEIARPVVLRPAGFESDVVFPSGRVDVRPDEVRLDRLVLSVDDATLRVDGMAHFQHSLAAGAPPDRIELGVAGEVSGRLFEYLAPDAISNAVGRARVQGRFSGTPARPELNARIDVAKLGFQLRGLGREILAESGTVEVDNTGVVLRGVRARIDEEGLLVIGDAGVRPGRIQFERFGPLDAKDRPPVVLGWLDLPLHGEGLTYRSPGSVEISDLAFDLGLAGHLDEGFELGGEVRLVAGRYVQDFKVTDAFISPRINESAVRPFYQGQPLIEDLALDLRVRTVGDGFVVQNNFAPEILLDVNLHVGGTVSDPRIQGDVRPVDGRFHVPGLRGDFELVPKASHVVFVETKSLDRGETPELNLEAQTLVTDSSGAEHNVRMRITGPLSQMEFDLSGDGGLDRNQAFMLLTFGRTSDEVGRAGAVRTGTDFSGQVTRDVVDNLVEPYVGETFRRITGLDLRLTVGADGFEGRVRFPFSRYFRAQADTLLGFQNQRRYGVQLGAWLLDYASLSALGQRLVLSPTQGFSDVQNSVKLELRVEWPLRF